MKGIDDLLERSLKAVGEAFEPASTAAAREQMLRHGRRRRWVAVGSAAAAVASAVALISLRSPQVAPPRTGTAAAEAMRVVAEIEVGPGPEAAAVGAGRVWVANAAGSTVSVIDPTTNKVAATLDVGGSPDEVVSAFGSLWVTTQQGRVLEIDGDTAEVVRDLDVPGGPGRLDIAAADDSIWVAVPSHAGAGDVWQIWPEAKGVSGEPDLPAYGSSDPGFEPTDVAGAGAGVWALDPKRGELREVYNTEREPAYEQPIFGFGAAPSGDLAAGFGALWVSLRDSGAVVRIDDRSGEIDGRATVGGGAIDLAIGDDEVWAIVGDRGDGSGAGRLYRLHPRTGHVMGDPLAIEGNPVDVAFGIDSAWVASKASDVVTRVK